jgi:cellulose biosynthesis protein BcsQ
MAAVEALRSGAREGEPCGTGPVLAIVNRKGGAGKTSAAHNIAGVWGTWGLRVCLVDLDTAFNLTEACGYPEELRPEGGAWLASGAPEPWPVPGMPNCALVPSGARLAAGIERMEKLAIDRERYLGKVLAPLRRRFDVLLLDTKPDLDLSVTGALAAATHVLATALTLPQPIYGVVRSLGLVEDLREGVPDLRVIGFLPMAYNARGLRPAALGSLVEMAEEYGVTCLPPIPYTEHVGKESQTHVPVALAYRNTPVGQHYRYVAALVGQHLGLSVPPEWLDRGRRLQEQMVREVLGT